MRCQILQPLPHHLQIFNFLCYGSSIKLTSPKVDLNKVALEGKTTVAPGRQVQMDPKVVWLLVFISDLSLFKTSPSSSAL